MNFGLLNNDWPKACWVNYSHSNRGIKTLIPFSCWGLRPRGARSSSIPWTSRPSPPKCGYQDDPTTNSLFDKLEVNATHCISTQNKGRRQAFKRLIHSALRPTTPTTTVRLASQTSLKWFLLIIWLISKEFVLLSSKGETVGRKEVALISGLAFSGSLNLVMICVLVFLLRQCAKLQVSYMFFVLLYLQLNISH